ncbi:putative ATP-dependent helicase DinG homolog [Micropruina glycogenica]|uniref:ATP-dependent helicase DinG n=2 Tax=Micropruina glycogenica TaxID=75385 RepID=A0A2N9JGW7_9ACTN|nr:putative ATP-dependent helicase DinG homolog [Micropruina glycogenica]
MPETDIAEAILAAAVAGIEGAQRPGQHQMAAAVGEALAGGDHLLVQAGTGTGKSLGYLAPALAQLVQAPDDRIVVATATLALQAQLARKDIPTALAACEQVTGRSVKHAILKGRTNYACLYRVRDGLGLEQESLIGGPELVEALTASAPDASSKVGAEVVALREWVETEARAKGLADRDDAPSHGNQSWTQVSIPVRECLGVQRCPYGGECFVERSRDRARAAQLVVTNHALLAIDAMHGGTALPEHDGVIIDEAHELVSRVTGAASHELSPQTIERVARRCLPWLDDDLGLDFLDCADTLKTALDDAPLDRVEDPDGGLGVALRLVRDVARRVTSALGGDETDNDRKQAAAAAKEVFDVAGQLAAMAAHDVVWVSERERFGRQVNQSPLSVAGLMREGIFAKRPAVLTSATLTIGGNFDAVAASVGLTEPYQADDGAEPELPRWRGLDVGSPFDYRAQGILYVARSLPPPGRDGIGPDTLAEVAELVWAAGGRTLGLFASQRAAEAAALHCRRELPAMTILCQGDAQLGELTRTFVAEPETSLFGTLSLWQGVDVPGDTCRLVIIDKIPFPRPDDPLLQARQRAVAERGGNGFMTVAATHAALLLAQGSGRLIRRLTDKGVVAVLDPRLVTARYGSFLRASMPDFWPTTDREVAIGALQRLEKPPEA